MGIVDFLAEIPNVIWAAIIASLLTLGGVLLTNRGNNKRLLEQIKHDASERDRERQMALRRDVYLKAAEAISKAYTTLMNLPQADLQAESWKADVNTISESLMKVHIVGNDDTVASTTRFSSDFSKALLKLMEKRFPLDQLKSRAAILSDLIEKSAQERDRYIALMKEFNLKGLTDQRLWEQIRRNYDFEEQQNQKYAKEREAIQQQYIDLLIELLTACYQKSIELGHVLVPALCDVRKEMDMPIDADRYRQLMEQTRTEMEVALTQFIEELNKKRQLKGTMP